MLLRMSCCTCLVASAFLFASYTKAWLPSPTITTATTLRQLRQQQQQPLPVRPPLSVSNWNNHQNQCSLLLRFSSSTASESTNSDTNDTKNGSDNVESKSATPPPTTTAVLEEERITISDNSDIEDNDDDDDDDEYEYVEYDCLTEAEFVGSEWLIGTNWDRNPGRIDETWARLVVDASGKNVIVWGDNSQGVWSLDVASQFLSLSKENVLAGKEIWACTVNENYYYLQGTVRGWKYWSAAAVLGQWQAKRLGVTDPDEAGCPPWEAPPPTTK